MNLLLSINIIFFLLCGVLSSDEPEVFVVDRVSDAGKSLRFFQNPITEKVLKISNTWSFENESSREIENILNVIEKSSEQFSSEESKKLKDVFVEKIAITSSLSDNVIFIGGDYLILRTDLAGSSFSFYLCSDQEGRNLIDKVYEGKVE